MYKKTLTPISVKENIEMMSAGLEKSSLYHIVMFLNSRVKKFTKEEANGY